MCYNLKIYFCGIRFIQKGRDNIYVTADYILYVVISVSIKIQNYIFDICFPPPR